MAMLLDLPIEVLDRVLSHVVHKNDYKRWAAIASVCKAFADYAEQYLPFEEVKIGRSADCVAAAKAHHFPRSYFAPPVEVTDGIALQLMERRTGGEPLRMRVHRSFMRNITRLNVMSCCPRTCLAMRVLKKLPLLENLTSLRIALALSHPEGPEVDLLLRHLPQSVKELHVILSSSMGQHSSPGSTAWSHLPNLQGFASLVQLDVLMLDTLGLMSALKYSPGYVNRVRADAVLHSQTIRRLVIQAMALLETAHQDAQPDPELDFCRTCFAEVSCNDMLSQEALADNSRKSPWLAQGCHLLGICVGIMRSRLATLGDHGAAVQQFCQGLRECPGPGWLDFSRMNNLRVLWLAGVDCAWLPESLQELHSSDLAYYSPLPEGLRVYNVQTSSTRFCLAHASFSAVERLEIHASASCIACSPLMDNVQLPRTFSHLSTLLLSPSFPDEEIASVLDVVDHAPRLAKIQYLDTSSSAGALLLADALAERNIWQQKSKEPYFWQRIPPPNPAGTRL